MRILWAVLLVSSFLSYGCNGGGGGTDGGPEPPALDERLGPGQVRAGVITSESELLEGPEAHGWIGDFKLYNDRVAFVVQNAFEPRGWGPYGGSLLDADWIRPEGEPGREVLQEVFTHIDVLSLNPTSAEVVSDGGDGGPAQVRVTGIHQGIPLIDAATNGALEPKDLEIVQDYVLEPDSDHLLIRTSLRTRTGSERNVKVGDLVLNGDLTVDFVPGWGDIDSDLPGGDMAYFGGYTWDSCNLYTGTEGDIRPAFSVEGITPITAGEGVAPRARGDEQPLTIERILVVGQGGMDDCLRKLRRLRGQESEAGLLSGTVVTSSGAPEAGAGVYALDQSLPEGAAVVDQTYTANDGSFEMELPAGDYRVEVHAVVRDPVQGEAVSVIAGRTASCDLQVPEAAVLAWACRGRDRAGADTGVLPCKISLQAGRDADMRAPVATDILFFGASGHGEAIVRPGDWTVTLSRGWEYSIERSNVSVEAGQRVEVEAVLTHQVDTDGYIAADLHSHSTRSDSDYEILDKLSSNIVEGVELMVATDHDCQADFAPWVTLLGQVTDSDASRWLRTVVGIEVSPLYGHMTVFPLPTHPTGWIYWQIPWVFYEGGRFSRSLEFPEIWQRCRELGAEVINVAHPTMGSGYFTYLGFEPPGVMPALDGLPQEKFGTGFDTMELLNSKDVDVMLEELVPLWSHLNNQGLFRTAVGVSDSHGRTSEAGFGRTMIASSTDDPRQLDLDEIWANLRAGRAAVGGGIFVTIRIAGGTMGDLVQASGQVMVHLEVQAADWVPVDRMDLIANGQVIASRGLAEAGGVDPDRPALRFDGAIPVDLAADTWFAALAYGAASDRLDPVFRSCRPVGMTNAVRVDADGNGAFDPPGI